jgi:hypothetical protein
MSDVFNSRLMRKKSGRNESSESGSLEDDSEDDLGSENWQNCRTKKTDKLDKEKLDKETGQRKLAELQGWIYWGSAGVCASPIAMARGGAGEGAIFHNKAKNY